MTNLLDEKELVKIVEKIRDSLYQDYEIGSKRELDLIISELQKTVDRDHRAALQQQNQASTVSQSEDYIK